MVFDVAYQKRHYTGDIVDSFYKPIFRARAL